MQFSIYLFEKNLCSELIWTKFYFFLWKGKYGKLSTHYITRESSQYVKWRWEYSFFQTIISSKYLKTINDIHKLLSLKHLKVICGNYLISLSAAPGGRYFIIISMNFVLTALMENSSTDNLYRIIHMQRKLRSSCR